MCIGVLGRNDEKSCLNRFFGDKWSWFPDESLTCIIAIGLYAERSKVYINAKKITSRKRDSTAAKRIIDRNVHIETKIKRIVQIN